MIKNLSVPFSILLPGRVPYIYHHISHFALDARKFGPIFMQSSLPRVLLQCFSTFPLSLEGIRMGAIDHDSAGNFIYFILYNLLDSCVMCYPDSLSTNKTDAQEYE